MLGTLCVTVPSMYVCTYGSARAGTVLGSSNAFEKRQILPELFSFSPLYALLPFFLNLSFSSCPSHFPCLPLPLSLPAPPTFPACLPLPPSLLVPPTFFTCPSHLFSCPTPSRGSQQIHNVQILLDKIRHIIKEYRFCW